MPDDEYRDFVDGARAIVLDLGKHLIGWQEIARAGIGAGDVIQYWMSLRPGVVDFTSLAELPEGMELPADPDPAIMETYAKAGRDIGLALAKGAQVLMSPLAVTYLDVGYADELEDPAQRGDWERVRMPVWPRITVEQAWDWEPTEWAPELPANAVAGVEAALWSEVVEDVRDLGFLLLPRLPGLAERAWSAAGQRDWAVYRPRIAAHAARWRRAGWTTYFRSAALADPPPVPAASPAERA
jgi:hexosaminidase